MVGAAGISTYLLAALLLSSKRNPQHEVREGHTREFHVAELVHLLEEAEGRWSNEEEKALRLCSGGHRACLAMGSHCVCFPCCMQFVACYSTFNRYALMGEYSIFLLRFPSC